MQVVNEVEFYGDETLIIEDLCAECGNCIDSCIIMDCGSGRLTILPHRDINDVSESEFIRNKILRCIC